MKKLIVFVTYMLASSAIFAATTVPVQLLNPSGSSAGQAIVSTGASSAPAWGQPTGTLIGVRVFTSSTTYTPTAGTNSVIVSIQGAGGAGGGSVATGASQFSCGAGGSGGGYIMHRMITGFSGATITIGAGGAGASGATGGNGGASSFAGITANGGSGGAISAAGSSCAIAPTAIGSASGGNILNIGGNPGGFSFGVSGTPALFAGQGGASILGGGGLGPVGGTGGAATGYGAGGGGTANAASAAAQTGGAGGAGVVIVWEYN